MNRHIWLIRGCLCDCAGGAANDEQRDETIKNKCSGLSDIKGPAAQSLSASSSSLISAAFSAAASSAAFIFFRSIVTLSIFPAKRPPTGGS